MYSVQIVPTNIAIPATMKNTEISFFSVFLCVCVRVFYVCSVQLSFFCVLWAKLPEIKLMMMIIIIT